MPLTSVFWGINFMGSTYFFWELLSQGKLGLSLTEATYLLPESFFSKGVLYTKIRMEVMKTLFFALVIASVTMSALFWFRKKKLKSTKLLRVPMALFGILFLLSTLINVTEPWLCKKTASERACIALSRVAFHQKTTNPAIHRWSRIILPAKIDQKTEQHLLQGAKEIVATKKPNLFLVVIDSLRADVLNSQTTPQLLSHFASEGSFSSVSPSNCTHSSWYSIFSGAQPYFWRNQMIQPSEEGSLPIRMLKNMGYKIHLITSQSLDPFRKKDKIFGVTRDSLTSYTGPDELESEKERMWALSGRAVKSLIQLLNQPGNDAGNAYVLALFATHWPYALGENFEPKFTPYMKEVTVEATLAPVENQHTLLKNRYLNSLSFVDDALGQLFDFLKSKNQWDQSAVFVFGDHGESFQPEKPMVHCSSLESDQVMTRLLVKPPQSQHKKLRSSKRLYSSLDVFPTVFDLLGIREEHLAQFEGRSLVAEGNDDDRRPVVSLNGGKSVFGEMRIFDGELSGFFELDGARALGRDLHVKEARLVTVKRTGQPHQMIREEDLRKMIRYFDELTHPRTQQETVAQVDQ